MAFTQQFIYLSSRHVAASLRVRNTGTMTRISTGKSTGIIGSDTNNNKNTRLGSRLYGDQNTMIRRCDAEAGVRFFALPLPFGNAIAGQQLLYAP